MRLLNTRLIFYTIGLVLLFESLFMLLTLVVTIIYQTNNFAPILASFIITSSIGLLLIGTNHKNRFIKDPTIRDSFLIVSLSWFFMSLFGSLPYILSDEIPLFVNAFFECISGFTTTGSSILTDIEALSKDMLFWRSITHLIGGMGIIVLVVAVFPFFNIGGNRMFSAESSKVSFEKIKPKIIDTTKRLWLIYMGLTFAQIILLKVAGMDWFDSICHSFATIATGGFSTKNASAAAFSPLIQYIITFFMFLAGMNFTLHYFMLKGGFSRVFRNEEFRFYLILTLTVTLTLTFLIMKPEMSIEKSFRDSLFQVVSIITTTGFATTDYLQWPIPGWMIIFFLMFVGGCAGSTAGGIKIIRHLLILKNVTNIIKRIITPHRVILLKYNNQPIDENAANGIMSFFFIYLLTFVIGTVVMIFTGLDFESAIGSVNATLGCVGPGIGSVGPVNNFYHISDFGKYFLSFLMLLGRLEFYSLLILFTPSFWKL